MSGQKVDLDELAFRAHRFDDRWLLALVRAVRAARAYWYDGPLRLVEQQEAELDAALAPFTDSAEVRSDGT